MPFGADNALVKAAEVVRRIAAFRPPSRLDESWHAFVAGLGLPAELQAPLLREEGFVETIEMLPLGLFEARLLEHAHHHHADDADGRLQGEHHPR